MRVREKEENIDIYTQRCEEIKGERMRDRKGNKKEGTEYIEIKEGKMALEMGKR